MPSEARSAKDGGARRDRTDDLLNANQMLFQLSYGPGKWFPAPAGQTFKEQSPASAATVLKTTKCDRRARAGSIKFPIARDSTYPESLLDSP